MAANGISTLSTKQAKQAAKLNLAKTKRQASGRKNVIDINKLPAKYTGNNKTPLNAALTPGRPWS